jgi:hypothetical protein
MVSSPPIPKLDGSRFVPVVVSTHAEYRRILDPQKLKIDILYMQP